MRKKHKKLSLSRETVVQLNTRSVHGAEVPLPTTDLFLCPLSVPCTYASCVSACTCAPSCNYSCNYPDWTCNRGCSILC